jgi:hypothetical protein
MKTAFSIRVGSLFLAFAVAFIALAMHLQVRLGVREPEEKVLYIPSGKFLKPAVLGYNQLAADLLWLKTLSYFGTHAITDRSYTWLPKLLEAVTTLDPYWDFPFHFAGIVLSIEGDLVEEANRIVKRGIDYHPNVWQFPFYIGFNYFHVKNNPVCGARYIYQASTYPDSPEFLKGLAAKLSSKGNSRKNHLEMCARLLNLTKDENMRKQIIKHCEQKLNSEVPEDAEQSPGDCQ